eukprot:9944788-Ditylum_brightwellii.AAC.1
MHKQIGHKRKSCGKIIKQSYIGFTLCRFTAIDDDDDDDGDMLLAKIFKQSTTTDSHSIKENVTIPSKRCEKDNCSEKGKTEIPPSVKQAGFQCIEYESQPWNVPSPDDTANDVRKQFSAIIHANPTGEDIAIVPSTSFALTMAAHNLYRTGLIQKNNRILILQDEMSSEDGGWTEAIIDKLASDSNDGSNKIAAVCLPQAH